MDRDRVETCRRAARDAVADVEPPQLHELITDTLADASMTPGALTLESAAAIDVDADLEGVAHHAAGVQLIYEGLRLTRTLAHEEPWAADGREGDHERGDSGDLAILAADILVARGFYLLARTDAADTAVRTVRNFGRDQTLRDQPDADRDDLDANLERDVLELAVRAGAAAVDSVPTPALVALAADMAADVRTGFPPAAECVRSLEPRKTDVGAEAETDAEADRRASLTDPVSTDRISSAGDP